MNHTRSNKLQIFIIACFWFVDIFVTLRPGVFMIFGAVAIMIFRANLPSKIRKGLVSVGTVAQSTHSSQIPQDARAGFAQGSARGGASGCTAGVSAIGRWDVLREHGDHGPGVNAGEKCSDGAAKMHNGWVP